MKEGANAGKLQQGRVAVADRACAHRRRGEEYGRLKERSRSWAVVATKHKTLT